MKGALFGFLLILIGTVITIFLVKNGSLFFISAGPGQDPKNVEITNVSDISFTLTYVTDDKIIGTLNYGTDPGNLDTVILDDRDQLSQSVNEYNTHSISVKNLEPDSVYYFTINSGDKTYPKNGSPYNIKTGALIEDQPSSKEPLSGKVLLPDGSSPTEGLVYLMINGAQKLSGYLKNDGNYTIPLNTLRNGSLNSYFSFSKNSIINIEVTTGTLFSSVSLLPDEINPVPVITLSNNYDFSGNNRDLKPIDTSGKGGFPSMGTNVRKNEIAPTPFPSEAPVETPTPASPQTAKITSTLTPTAIPSISIAPSPTIPPTGNSSVIITLISGAAAFGAGLILLLLARGQVSL